MVFTVPLTVTRFGLLQCQTRFEKTRIWSCCLSADPLAEGCIVSTVNPDAYNFASFT
jgi:hypothetical protein